MYPWIQCFPLHTLRPYLTERQGRLHLQKMKLVSYSWSMVNLLLLTEYLISGSWCAVCRWEAANIGSCCDTSTLGQILLVEVLAVLEKKNRRMLFLSNKLSLSRNKSYAAFSRFYIYVFSPMLLKYIYICVYAYIYIHTHTKQAWKATILTWSYWFNQKHFHIFCHCFLCWDHYLF